MIISIDCMHILNRCGTDLLKDKRDKNKKGKRKKSVNDRMSET